jgi:hypothetical protein
MKHEIKDLSDLAGGMVIETDPPKCDTCLNDKAGTCCVKLHLYGGEICVAK